MGWKFIIFQSIDCETSILVLGLGTQSKSAQDSWDPSSVLSDRRWREKEKEERGVENTYLLTVIPVCEDTLYRTIILKPIHLFLLL